MEILQPVCKNEECQFHELYCVSDRLSFSFIEKGKTWVIVRIPVDFANSHKGAYCEECHFKIFGGDEHG